MSTYSLGNIIEVRVTGVNQRGVYVKLLNGSRGFIHKRELTIEGDINPKDVVSIGDYIEAEVIRINEDRDLILLSVRKCLPDPINEFFKNNNQDGAFIGEVKRIFSRGYFVRIGPGVIGYLPLFTLPIEAFRGLRP